MGSLALGMAGKIQRKNLGYILKVTFHLLMVPVGLLAKALNKAGSLGWSQFRLFTEMALFCEVQSDVSQK